MKYDALSHTTVKIILSEEDMKEYSLQAEGIKLHTLDSKQKLTQLLSGIKLFSEYTAERLFLEVFPRKEGGCVLYVSALGEKMDGGGALCCAVDGLDTLIRLCRAVFALEIKGSTDVYKLDKGYVLIIAADDKSDRLNDILSEYGKPTRSINQLMRIYEYGEEVITGNAAEILSALF